MYSRGANEVTDEDVYSVVTLCLRDRLRKDPMATIDEGTKVLEVFSSVFGYDSEELARVVDKSMNFMMEISAADVLIEELLSTHYRKGC